MTRDKRTNQAHERSRLEATFTREPAAHWVEFLNDAGCPAGPVQNVAEVFEDPQIRHRELVVELQHPELGMLKTIASPPKLSRTPVRITRPAPLVGEHGREVLTEIAGMTDDDVDRLVSSGVARIDEPGMPQEASA